MADERAGAAGQAGGARGAARGGDWRGRRGRGGGGGRGHGGRPDEYRRPAGGGRGDPRASHLADQIARPRRPPHARAASLEPPNGGATPTARGAHSRPRQRGWSAPRQCEWTSLAPGDWLATVVSTRPRSHPRVPTSPPVRGCGRNHLRAIVAGTPACGRGSDICQSFGGGHGAAQRGPAHLPPQPSQTAGCSLTRVCRVQRQGG